MQRPEEVNLSREGGEALIKRLEGDALTGDDRRVLVQLIRLYFWLLFALQEARFSLKRLRGLLFGEMPKKRKEKPPNTSSGSKGGDGGTAAGWEYRRTGRTARGRLLRTVAPAMVDGGRRG